MSEQRTSEQPDFCCDCGMSVSNGEYHPYAACLMFKQCHDAPTVRGNLNAVVKFGYDMCYEEMQTDD